MKWDIARIQLPLLINRHSQIWVFVYTVYAVSNHLYYIQSLYCMGFILQSFCMGCVYSCVSYRLCVYRQWCVLWCMFMVCIMCVYSVCMVCVYCVCVCMVLLWGVQTVGGAAKILFQNFECANCVFYTNRQNTGLISADRRTSLLSRVQYPVLYQSRLQGIFHSQCPKCDYIWCWAEAYRYA